MANVAAEKKLYLGRKNCKLYNIHKTNLCDGGK